jgi:undecaprenyl-diphosphatase
MYSVLQSEQVSFLQEVLHWDYRLMLWVNRDLSSPMLDLLTLFMRESIFHFAFMNLGKKGWWWLLGGIALVSFADLISSHFIKDYFNRPRPCRDPYMAHQINFLAKYCGANGSFTSSHAVNHFAFATYVFGTLKQYSPYFSIFFLWAGIISFSQVYVGVHYPSDVIFGGILGAVFGWIAVRISRQALSLH